MLTKQNSIPEKKESVSALPRRQFLGKMGAAAGFTALAVACQKTISPSDGVVGASSSDNSVFGTGDIAILNYAYLLEQLEAAFYIMVVDNFYSGGYDWGYEKTRFKQIRDHEIAHREFFKTALGDSAIDEAEFDFSSVNFADRTSVLTTSKTFEDLGVSAYNGVAQNIVNADYLLAAGKIVSVEGRHASFVRNLLDPGSFADNTVVDSNGLDVANPPSVVIPNVLPYLKTTMNFKGIPTM